ncbi:hypothetical protein CY34DRAFT_804286 [Suillus luteus UH-Slu-Lm8-n1]|uniref:Uncharacterized protein n=1 Tax=Suillus luteus UH-Slu-Lm8-n1 TaxID=930992 RepID=A0A0D0BIP5_9AGAM|nr:hypothetical protein CY34DRAFT_804286 [Suillus luteus UH-Slu-Lm8-n1]
MADHFISKARSTTCYSFGDESSDIQYEVQLKQDIDCDEDRKTSTGLAASKKTSVATYIRWLNLKFLST